MAQNDQGRDFPGGPVGKTLCSRGLGLISGQGTRPRMHAATKSSHAATKSSHAATKSSRAATKSLRAATKSLHAATKKSACCN